MVGGRKNKAAAARARMASRAKRQRWWKENKKRVMYIVLSMVLLALLAFFTPWGPQYYRGQLENNKFESPGRLAPGYIQGMYNLGTFYLHTMRNTEALECYNEIANLYFAFKVTDFAQNSASALDKRDAALLAVRRGQRPGPPFQVDDSEVKYVGMAVWRAGEILRKQLASQFIFRIFNDIYLEEFLPKNEGKDDPETTKLVTTWVNKFRGFQ